MITDKAIKSAILSVERGEAAVRELSDESERGGGRLHFKARAAKGRASAEFFVTWQRAKKRQSLKLGSYPTLPLAEARRMFREQYLPVILKGENPIGPRAVVARGRGTVRELFEAYIDYLGERPTAKYVRPILLGRNGVANAIGPDRPAAAIRAQHLVPYLASIYERGAVCQANNVRNVVHAAFTYGIRSANSYFNTAGARDWGLQFNPISAVPSNASASQPRHRALSEPEVKAFWRWLEINRGRNPAFDALRLEIATGQRACEILSISTESYDRERRLLSWKKTKNGLPHCIPLPRQAVEVLDALEPNEHGLFFPTWHVDGERARSYTVARLVRRYITETGAEPFEARDLRRTWKTLAGAAGILKSDRDRLQNHALGDVSSKHYDKWEYMPEKRAAMVVWEAYLDQILASEHIPDHELPPQVETLERLRDALGDHTWRAAPQARHHPDWIGTPVAAALDLDRVGKGWREAALQAALRLEKQGVLIRSMIKDHKSRPVPVLSFCHERAEAAGLAPSTQSAPRRFTRSTRVDVSKDRLRQLKAAMKGQAWRAAPQALRQPDWIGIPVAEALDLDRRGKWTSRANRFAFDLEQQGVLVRTTGREAGTDREVPMYVFSAKVALELDGPEAKAAPTAQPGSPYAAPERPTCAPVQAKGAQGDLFAWLKDKSSAA